MNFFGVYKAIKIGNEPRAYRLLATHYANRDSQCAKEMRETVLQEISIEENKLAAEMIAVFKMQGEYSVVGKVRDLPPGASEALNNKYAPYVLRPLSPDELGDLVLEIERLKAERK